MLFLEAVGVREYCNYDSRKSVGSSVLGAFPLATRASRAAKPRPIGLLALDFAESRQSYVFGKMTSIPRAAAMV